MRRRAWLALKLAAAAALALGTGPAGAERAQVENLVVSLEGALRTAGDRDEVAAASLGASPTTVFRRITLPLVMPGLVSGAVLAFARALGEFGATITFAGSLQGRTRTLPLEIYLQRETDPDAAVALALVLLVVAVVVIGFARQGRSSI